MTHANGAAFEPVAPGSLKNHEMQRRKVLIFPIPAEECPPLMDQAAQAVAKVARGMSSLAREQARRPRG